MNTLKILTFVVVTLLSAVGARADWDIFGNLLPEQWESPCYMVASTTYGTTMSFHGSCDYSPGQSFCLVATPVGGGCYASATISSVTVKGPSGSNSDTSCLIHNPNTDVYVSIDDYNKNPCAYAAGWEYENLQQVGSCTDSETGNSRFYTKCI